jgi:hypothetical protein
VQQKHPAVLRKARRVAKPHAAARRRREREVATQQQELAVLRQHRRRVLQRNKAITRHERNLMIKKLERAAQRKQLLEQKRAQLAQARAKLHARVDEETQNVHALSATIQRVARRRNLRADEIDMDTFESLMREAHAVQLESKEHKEQLQALSRTASMKLRSSAAPPPPETVSSFAKPIRHFRKQHSSSTTSNNSKHSKTMLPDADMMLMIKDPAKAEHNARTRKNDRVINAMCKTTKVRQCVSHDMSRILQEMARPGGLPRVWINRFFAHQMKQRVAQCSYQNGQMPPRSLLEAKLTDGAHGAFRLKSDVLDKHLQYLAQNSRAPIATQTVDTSSFKLLLPPNYSKRSNNEKSASPSRSAATATVEATAAPEAKAAVSNDDASASAPVDPALAAFTLTLSSI